jgi:hypothetical protein
MKREPDTSMGDINAKVVRLIPECADGTFTRDDTIPISDLKSTTRDGPAYTSLKACPTDLGPRT